MSFIQNFKYWNYLAINEIKQKYRRSILGTLWLSLSTAITILGIGPLYSVLFKTDISKYFIIVSIGLISWGFISGVIGESCSTFIANSGMIKDTSLPIETYVQVVVWRNVLLYFQNIIILYLIFNIFGFTIYPNYSFLFACIVVTLYLSNIAMVLAIICLRFRDLAQIVDSAMKLLFFISPILWVVNDTKLENSKIIIFNPFFYIIELLRNSFINNIININHILIILIQIFIIFILKKFLHTKYKNKIVYWL